MTCLRPLVPADLAEIREVYGDAVRSQTPTLYTPAQVLAWADHAAEADVLAIPLQQGYGLASTTAGPAETNQPGRIEAFGILHPLDRLSLLYCRGRAGRQGRASAILVALERHAQQRGILRLRTEASQLSRPLLERRGWQVEAEETVLFAGVWFQRWRMIRVLPPISGRSGDDERG
ncbi:MAG: GNAT family N-acetyltransferase [Cyanobium sp.]|nr:GNAT family N-acetyltransferase [Cyanobium sp.]